MKPHFAILAATIGLSLLALGYWFIEGHLPRPLRSNVCMEMIESSIEAAQSNSLVVVPSFSIDSLEYIHCEASAGITNFSIAGRDTSGIAFQIFETIGGRAASGADSVFDYCYIKSGKVASQIRITGREGVRGDSTCKHDDTTIVNPEYSYIYGHTI